MNLERIYTATWTFHRLQSKHNCMDQLDIKVKYLAGYHTSGNMTNPGYLEQWIKSAKEAEAENYELVVFKIPRKVGLPLVDSVLVAEVEALLQKLIDNVDFEMTRTEIDEVEKEVAALMLMKSDNMFLQSVAREAHNDKVSVAEYVVKMVRILPNSKTALEFYKRVMLLAIAGSA
jgi:hypothetical protein